MRRDGQRLMVVAGVPEVDHSDGSDGNGGGGARAEVKQQQQHANERTKRLAGVYTKRRSERARARDQMVTGAAPVTKRGGGAIRLR